jgi:hypothetical protein
VAVEAEVDAAALYEAGDGGGRVHERQRHRGDEDREHGRQGEEQSASQAEALSSATIGYLIRYSGSVI